METSSTGLGTLVIEDHALTRVSLASLLAGLDLPVAQSGSLEDAFRIARTAPDLRLAVLNCDIAGPPNFDGYNAFNQRFPNVPVLISGGGAILDLALGALDAGAAGYVPRTMAAEGILIAARLVLLGERFIPSFLVERRNAGILRSRNPDSRGQIASLTQRQRQVLKLVARGAPNKIIARDLNLHEVTVKAHLRSIYRTLGVNSRTEAARTAFLSGEDLADWQADGGDRKSPFLCATSMGRVQ